ncbi:hypothetical protein [Pannonibacter tanglangensis]|uniref:Uncharacterized protein n=1 Tax=Pannonibacter tanglangensis TaxID=2750084 RepID=A0ABW9ZGK2_9HYPH|nr:hypothetical protein [Pannonibacter sp. XCT-34]NBN63828.1 hypothetical protein [Pannonibacter sp. XCT-34]
MTLFITSVDFDEGSLRFFSSPVCADAPAWVSSADLRAHFTLGFDCPIGTHVLFGGEHVALLSFAQTIDVIATSDLPRLAWAAAQALREQVLMTRHSYLDLIDGMFAELAAFPAVRPLAPEPARSVAIAIISAALAPAGD